MPIKSFSLFVLTFLTLLAAKGTENIAPATIIGAKFQLIGLFEAKM